LNGKFTGLTDVSSTEVKCTFKPYVCSPDDQSFYLQNGSYHFGKLTMLKKRKVANLEPNSYSGTSFIANGTDGMKAHSGKKMMKINGSMMFEQQRICVQKNKPYVLSLWISRTAQDVKTYEVSNLVQIVSINTPNGTFSTLPAVVKYGKVIEGWQKVDLEFIVDASNYSPDNVLAIRFNTSNKALYVDDVRLSPKVGGMKTFVYDPDTYWLKASLNVDNYATFYHYNDQGALTLMKQETEKGIFTVSENRARLQKQ
jgi:hypothetical protein